MESKVIAEPAGLACRADVVELRGAPTVLSVLAAETPHGQRMPVHDDGLRLHSSGARSQLDLGLRRGRIGLAVLFLHEPDLDQPFVQIVMRGDRRGMDGSTVVRIEGTLKRAPTKPSPRRRYPSAMTFTFLNGRPSHLG